MLINNDLLSLGIISCLQNKAIEATFYQENTWESMQDTLQQTSFDLLIIDGHKSDYTHVNAFDKIRRKYPSLKTILLGDEAHKQVTVAYLKKGIEGVCMKSISQQNFLLAYATVMNGKKYLDESITEYLLADLRDNNHVGKLSTRESQVANLLIQGMRTASIADRLNLAVSTVSTIKFNIYRKMQVQNIVDLAGKLEHTRRVQSI